MNILEKIFTDTYKYYLNMQALRGVYELGNHTYFLLQEESTSPFP